MRFSPPPEESRFLDPLDRNATKYFNEKFKKSMCTHGTQWATFPDGTKIYFRRKFYQDEEAGVQYRVLVIDDLGKSDIALHAIAQYDFKGAMGVQSMPTARRNVPSAMMRLAPRIYIYTNKLHCDEVEIAAVFHRYQPDVFVEIADESKMHQTLFISYGSPDEEFAAHINRTLKAKGVRTWFFPEDSVPGQKLHRMMSDAVYAHDRTLLLCSRDSVTRGGVLNEIERLLEREASEGGADIIIPVALDDYIFDEWMPEKADIKRQVTSRVVCRINDENFDSEIEKIVMALRH